MNSNINIKHLKNNIGTILNNGKYVIEYHDEHIIDAINKHIHEIIENEPIVSMGDQGKYRVSFSNSIFTLNLELYQIDDNNIHCFNLLTFFVMDDIECAYLGISE
jgi:hypothetical protein